MVITIWYRYNQKEKRWLHNHISDDYDPDCLSPIPRFDSQARSWANGEWKAFPGKLINHEVIWDEPKPDYLTV